jgi:arylsulfatase
VAIGADRGAPVTDEYAPPFEFTGTIHRVIVDVSGELIVDSEAELRAVMARQ